MTEIEAGQVWVRQGGSGYGEDQITILEDVSGPDDEHEKWDAQYGDGETTTLPARYIQRVFEYRDEHPESWEFTDREGDVLHIWQGYHEPENVVFSTTGAVVLLPDDIDALMHWLTTHKRVVRGA